MKQLHSEIVRAWNEYATRTAKDNSIRMKREREERRARNLAAFNRDRLTVRA